MKTLIATLMLSLVVSSCEKKQNAPQQNLIISGQVDTIDSQTLGQTRDIWIHLPASAQKPENKNVKYPVVYLLDGNWHFHSVMGIMRQLSLVNLNTALPEMILVAIPHKDRYNELTPTHVGDSNNASGGGEKFMNFLTKELIPYIDQTYPTDGERTLVGHSLGGLMVINALVNYKDHFDNYLSIDPSLWWDQQKLLIEALGRLETEDFSNKKLFVGIANTIKNDLDTASVMLDTAKANIHIQSILQFSKKIDQMPRNGLRFNWKYYPKQNHGSIPVSAEYDGLPFLLEGHANK